MRVPLEITFRNLENTPAISAYIRGLYSKLEQFSESITSCKVVVEIDQKHKTTPVMHNVRVHLNLPGKELATIGNTNSNLYRAVHNAFNKIQRQMDDYIQTLDGHIKHHADTLEGRIVRVFKKRQFGFIETASGDEYYFSYSNCTNLNRAQPVIGANVKFIEDAHGDSLQAHRVKVSKQRRY